MNRFESLIRAIYWLGKRDWGRAILLGLGSVLVLGVLAQEIPDILEGPVYRAGFYLGTILMPQETPGGHSLFGLAAVILALTGFWFVALRIGRALFGSKTAK